MENMASIIEWETYLGLPPVTDGAVAAVEAELGIRFPADFREVLLLHQGKLPSAGHDRNRSVESRYLRPDPGCRSGTGI